jgi:hypothetical protein
VLTFTEAPASGDLIDVREITTTTTVTSITNSSGNAAIAASPTSALVSVTGDMSISGNLTVTGNATLSGNILGDRIQNGTTQIDIQTTNGNANITVGGTSNVAVFSPTIVTLAANLMPSANITYDLGSTTQRWKDLWLSNSTIYLGNSQISANATALIFTNPAGGQTVLAGATAGITCATVSATGNVTGGNILTGGLISATGNISGGNLIISGVVVDQVGNLDLQTTSTNGNINLITNGSGNIYIGSNIMPSSANATANIGSSTAYFNTAFVKATSAQYADLAEKYTADAEYAPGTVVAFGGTHEVTLSTQDADRRVAGVVSTNPSYIMNGGLEGANIATVALTGRVPTKVTGTVAKGDLMVSNGDGTARAEADPRAGAIIGKALEDSEGDAVIEVVVGRF